MGARGKGSWMWMEIDMVTRNAGGRLVRSVGGYKAEREERGWK
jgi:hypothetical protein